MSYGRFIDPLKTLKHFKDFNSLKISLKKVLKTIKNNFFKERGFYQIPLLKTKNC